VVEGAIKALGIFQEFCWCLQKVPILKGEHQIGREGEEGLSDRLFEYWGRGGRREMDGMKKGKRDVWPA